MKAFALVVTDPWRQNVKRRPTFAETFALACAFADGDFTGENRCIRNAATIWPGLNADWLTRPMLEYATIRDYLINEHDADPRIAAQCALRLTSFRDYLA